MSSRESKRANSGARFLQLLGIRIPVELGADQHAGVGIAVCKAPVVKVSEKAQGLALGRLLLRGMRVGSRFRLLHWRGWGRLRGEEPPVYQAGCQRRRGRCRANQGESIALLGVLN